MASIIPKVPRPQKEAPHFEVVVKRLEKPFSNRPMDDLDWICGSLGFLEPIDRKRTASAVFKEILKATEEGKRVSSTDLALRVGMSTTVEIDTGHSRSFGSLMAGLAKIFGLSTASATAKR
mgnify:CR=1 FL=1